MGSTREYSQLGPLLSSQPALQSPPRAPSPRSHCRPPWPEVAAGLWEALILPWRVPPPDHAHPRSRRLLDVRRLHWGSNKVITAGHCCDGMSAYKLVVEVGSHNLYEDDPDQQSFAVAEVGLHEDYNSFNINNDICMLTLDGTISMGANVGTISIPI